MAEFPGPQGMFPFMIRQGPSSEPPNSIAIPPRVAQAMQFLSLMQEKSLDHVVAAAGDTSQVLDGKELSTEESATETAALQVLAKYFDGKLDPDCWEDLKLQDLVAKLEPSREEDHVPSGGKALKCLECREKPEPNPECPLCEGTGVMTVFPGAGDGIGGFLIRLMDPPNKDEPHDKD